MKSRIVRSVILLCGFPLLAWLAWVWLGIGEATVLQLLSSVLLGLVIVTGLTTLVALAVADSWELRPWLGRAGLIVLCFGLLVLAMWFAGDREKFAQWLALRVAAWRETVEDPAAYHWILPALKTAGILIALAVLMPSILLRTMRPCASLKYWGVWLLIGTIGIYLPIRLLYWVPSVQGVTAQSVSLGLRVLAGYVLILSCAVALCALLRTWGSPPEAGPNAATELR